MAFVTGASGGLGQEISRSLAAAGADLALGFHRDRAGAESSARRIRDDYGVQVYATGGDLSLAADVDRMVSSIEDTLGPVAILINNAGINPRLTIDSITEADWSRTLAVNVTSAFLVSQRVLPQMRQAKCGRIVMMSSIAAQTGGVIGPHYAASKAGMLGLMHSYAGLLAAEGITVNAVAPALVATDMIKDNPATTPDLLPVKRFGEPIEIAQTILWLVSNGYVTGQTINVNGDWYHS